MVRVIYPVERYRKGARSLPEGPEIRRAADRITEVLAGRRLRRLFFAFPRLKPFEKRLRGRTVCAVEARGKAILMHFDNGCTLYSHNQLYGRWHIVAGDDYPQTTRSLRVALHTADHAVLLYSASDIAILKSGELDRHPYLSRLGLELLQPETGVDAVAALLAQGEYRRRCLMGLLQDQRVLAGMGNYLCCEALHVSGIHPRQRPSDLGGDRLRRLAENCLELTRRSYRTGGVTNAPARAEALRKQGVAFEDYRFHVYRRAGQPCYHCGEIVIKDRFCGRMGYICPGCQRFSR